MSELPLFPPVETKRFTFFCEGVPAPGGSKQIMPVWIKGGACKFEWRNGKQWPIFRVIDDADMGSGRNSRWKDAVAWQAKSFMRGARPFTDPIRVEFIFFLRRPQCHYRTGKFSNLLRDDAPEHHTGKPDALKFARSTEDALTGILWGDDSANIRICSEKRWMKGGDRQGCAVSFIVLPSRPSQG